MTSIGLWIDDPVTMIKKAPYWDEVKRHGVTTAAIMLEGIGKGFDPKYTPDDLKKIRDLAVVRNDIEVVLTIWPQPQKRYLDELEAEIEQYIEASGCAGLEFDLEGNWIPSAVEGFKDLEAAGNRLLEIVNKLRAKYALRIEVTTFTLHHENGPRAYVAKKADRLLPQAYSVRNRTTGPADWDHPYGPEKMQKLTLDRALTVPGEQKLSCGLAAYDQVWPGKTGEEGMKAAFDAAMQYSPEEIRFWSSKWVLGMKKNGYASRFLLSLKKGV